MEAPIFPVTANCLTSFAFTTCPHSKHLVSPLDVVASRRVAGYVWTFHYIKVHAVGVLRLMTGCSATFLLGFRASQYWRMRGISASQFGHGIVRLHK